MKPITPNRPHLIMMVGIPGAGKSYFAEHFAETFGAPIVSAHKLGDSSAVAYMLGELFKTGQTIILDDDLSSQKQRDTYKILANKADYAPLLVWVQTESLTAKVRAVKHSGITEAEFDKRLTQFAAPTAAEKAAVISGKHTYASQLKIVLIRLAGDRPHNDTPPPPRRSVLVQ